MVTSFLSLYNFHILFQDKEAANISAEFLSSGDTEVAENPVLRKLFPEKQALNLGELEKLVDADLLDLTNQQLEEQTLKEKESEETKKTEEETESKSQDKVQEVQVTIQNPSEN